MGGATPLYLSLACSQVYQALLAERDSYMANSLRNSPGQRIVGVVGIAHMDGIEKKLGYERINC